MFKSLMRVENSPMMTSESTEVQSTHAVSTEGENSELKSIDLSALKNVCPAFETGCPYVKVGTKDDLKKCPEFKNGCPYKDSDNMEDVYKKLSQMPGFSLTGPHGEKLSETLGQVHEISKELENSMGKCPVFTEQGCPFKTVCSDGQPLIGKLDIQRWTEVLQGSADSIIIECAEAEGVQLSKELKERTKKLHREVQKIHFIKELLKGRVEKYWYKVLLADLYHIYIVLEEESAKHADHPYFKAVHYPKELSRAPPLEEDLEFYYGPDWREQIEGTEISPATKEYIDRMREVSSQDPIIFMAHHYSRYMGDLSGGQVMPKIMKKAFDLPESGGVSFYQFEHVPDPKEFKDVYRSQLDKLCIGKEKADEIVNEAAMAFLLNIKLFKELDALAGYEEPESKKPKEAHSNGDMGGKAKSSGQCPASRSKEQVALKLAPVKPLLTNPLVWALAAAILAAVLGLLAVKAY